MGGYAALERFLLGDRAALDTWEGEGGLIVAETRSDRLVFDTTPVHCYGCQSCLADMIDLDNIDVPSPCTQCTDDDQCRWPFCDRA